MGEGVAFSALGATAWGAFGGPRPLGAVPRSAEAPAWVSQARSRTVGCTRMACLPRQPTSSPKVALRIRSGTLNCQTCLLDKYFLAASGRGGSPKALSPCTGPAGEIVELNASSPFLYNPLWFCKRYTTVSLSSWQLQ